MGDAAYAVLEVARYVLRGLDIMVNTLGRLMCNAIVEDSEDEFDQVLGVNAHSASFVEAS